MCVLHVNGICSQYHVLGIDLRERLARRSDDPSAGPVDGWPHQLASPRTVVQCLTRECSNCDSRSACLHPSDEHPVTSCKMSTLQPFCCSAFAVWIAHFFSTHTHDTSPSSQMVGIYPSCSCFHYAKLSKRLRQRCFRWNHH